MSKSFPEMELGEMLDCLKNPAIHETEAIRQSNVIQVRTLIKQIEMSNNISKSMDQAKQVFSDRVRELNTELKLAGGEIAVFKQALCETIDKVNDASNKTFWASVIFSAVMVLLTAVIAFSAYIQAFGK
jgi:hypothetical protein